MEDVTNYIKPELLVLVPVLYIAGVLLKRYPIPDRLIPLILGGASILLSCVWILATSEIASYRSILNGIFVAVTQGILCAGASVYANQIYKQMITRKGEK